MHDEEEKEEVAE
jgi:hypothetical protein